MIETETLVGWGIGVVMFIGHAFVANYRIDKNEKELANVWKWKEMHVKESGEIRERFQTSISELKGSQMVVNEQFKQIMFMLIEIKDRLSALENHKGDK